MISSATEAYLLWECSLPTAMGGEHFDTLKPTSVRHKWQKINGVTNKTFNVLVHIARYINRLWKKEYILWSTSQSFFGLTIQSK